MGKTTGDIQRGRDIISRGYQKRAMKPVAFATQFSRWSAIQKPQRYSPPSLEKTFATGTLNINTIAEKPLGATSSSSVSVFHFRDYRSAIDEPKESDDKLMFPTTSFLDESHREDTSTQSLLKVVEDDALTECMDWLTSDETETMLQGFDLYVQRHHDNHHHKYGNPGSVDKAASIVTGNKYSNDYPRDLASTTPKSRMSPKTLLWGRSTSASVDGIYGKNGFEPDIYTLDGVRKDLFG